MGTAEEVAGTSHSVGRARADVGHNGDDDVLLNGEWARIERDPKDLDARDKARPCAHEWEGDQLGHNLRGGVCQTLGTKIGRKVPTPVIVTLG